jgi:hypothetical protein
MTCLLRYKLSLTVAVVLALLYAFQSLYQDFIYVFSNAFPPFIAGAAVATALIGLRKYGYNLGILFSFIWFCFTLGVALWFLGELGWAIYTLALGVEIPYPSLADIFWLSGYLPFFIALLLYLKPFTLALSKRSIGVVSLIIAALCIFVVVSLIPQLYSAQEDLVTLAVDLAYPILDLLLFALALLGVAVFFKGKIGKSWLLISLALALTAVADLTFSYTILQGTYYNGHPIELLYHWAYILYALAFYVHSKEL